MRLLRTGEEDAQRDCVYSAGTALSGGAGWKKRLRREVWAAEGESDMMRTVEEVEAEIEKVTLARPEHLETEKSP